MPERIFRSEAPPAHIPTDMSVWQYMLQYNPDNVLPEKVILEQADDPSTTFTYGGIRLAAAQGAAGLKDILKISPGDVVLIVALNHLHWFHCAHAIIWAGGVIGSTSPAATSHELVHYITTTEPKYIFTDSFTFRNVDQALKMLPASSTKSLPQILGLSTQMPSSSLVFPRDFMNSGSTPAFDLGHQDNRKTAGCILFSSGTSGKPKGVLLSHHNLISQLASPRVMDPSSYNMDQREVFYAPFCHLFGLSGCLLAAPFLGNYIMVMRTYSFQAYISACAKIRATVLRVVPPTAILITKDPFVKGLDLKSVERVTCAGAPLQTEVVNALSQMLDGCYITQGYGMTEWTGTSLRCNVSAWKAGSVGKLSTNQMARIVDDDMNDVAPGEQGELIVKGPGVFMSYINNPEETKAAFHDGWLRTGDVLRVDEDGFFWITDRKKELIKYKGNQVPPAELEDVLLSHPAVAEAACCGIWNEEQQTEVPMAYVKLQPAATERTDREAVLREIQQYVDGRVSRHKRLRGGVHYLEVIPKNPTGKLLRRFLPARMEAEAKEAAKKMKNNRQAKL